VDLHNIFPRLYPSLPSVGEADVTLSHDDSPVETPFAGDVIIFYGYDEGSAYDIISNRTLQKLDITKDWLHQLSIENLSKTEKEIQLHKADGFSFVTCDGDLEASLILHTGIWDYIEAQIGEDILASVPARDTLLVSGISRFEISALKKKTCEYLEMAQRPISLSLFSRLNGSWQLYEA
jgi:uncharacterized protein YtpQ (UPF0354 family)